MRTHSADPAGLGVAHLQGLASCSRPGNPHDSAAFPLPERLKMCSTACRAHLQGLTAPLRGARWRNNADHLTEPGLKMCSVLPQGAARTCHPHPTTAVHEGSP